MSAPRLLVTGANGQVGFELVRALAPLGGVVAATREGVLGTAVHGVALDLADTARIGRVLDDVRPDVVINPAAYTAVDRAESEPDLAQGVNVEAVAAMAAWCRRRDVPLVHYSTDYVFDGRADRPWREDDATGPMGVYGASKLAGEAALRASDARHLILRTAWVYAARGGNFLRTMLRLGAERDVLRVVADQTGAPTPARWIASATALLVARLLAGEDDAPSGTFHLAAGGATTWHGFAEEIFRVAAVTGLLARVPSVAAITTADYPTPAKRPAYSVLDCARLSSRCGIALPDWRIGVAQVIAEIADARR